MARLPSDRFLIQQVESEVVLFAEHTEEEIVRFDPKNAEAVARAQRLIGESTVLDEEDRAMAHFWSGYFWAHATSTGLWMP
jgi:hypothetical protein